MATNTSRAEDRRKLQNRLNQRARRQRIAEQHKVNGPVRKWVIYTDAQIDAHDRLDDRADTKSGPQNTLAIVPYNQSDSKTLFCQLPPNDRRALLQHLQEVVSHNFLQRVLDSELLTSVTQHNIVRAMTLNASYLGLTIELLREDINSPFNALQSWAVNVNDLPPSLQPTSLQQQVVHHPWIDLCPHASLRNAMLQRAGTYDEDELCQDLFMESGDSDESQIGIVVWGESWDPAAYEVSPSILRKWSWIAHDCLDIIQSTNYWRAQRQEGPLRILPATKNVT